MDRSNYCKNIIAELKKLSNNDQNKRIPQAYKDAGMGNRRQSPV